MQRTLPAVLLLLVLPLLGNWPAVSGWLSVNPVYRESWLGYDLVPGPVGGRTSLDPNDGITTQALGRLAAESWLDGRAPWWNPYGGVGLPLAAEGQNPALLLPYVLLLWFRNGPLLLGMALQATAGLSMFALLRALRLSRAASAAGGGLFALNGTFAWFGHGPVAPVAFAPLLLLGVERAAARAAGRGPGGWRLAALAVALSLYAAFPETAYLDGLLAAAWAAARAARMDLRTLAGFAARLAAAACAGLLLAAPYLLPFAQLVAEADIGIHANGQAALTTPAPALGTTFLPYMFGGLAEYDVPDPSGRLFWLPSFLGGYVTSATLLLALAAILARGAPDRTLRLVLAAWCAAMLGETYGVPLVTQAVRALPLIGLVQVFRYAAPSWELAAAALAAMALDDWLRGRPSPRAASACALGLAAVCVLIASPALLRLWSAAPSSAAWFAGSLASAAFASAGLARLLAGPPTRRRAGLAVALVLAEAASLFSIPRLAGLRGGGIDLPAVAFLREHLGLGRAYGIGRLVANYGAFFGTAALDADYLPAPRLWAEDAALLDPPAPLRLNPDGTSSFDKPLDARAADALARLPLLRARGAAYLVAPAGLLAGGPAPAPRAGGRADPLGPGESFSARAPPGGAPGGGIGAVAFRIGTYAGASDGALRVTACAEDVCREGEAALDAAADDAPLLVELDSPLPARAGAELSLTIRHLGGRSAVALWTWPDEAGAGRALDLQLLPARPDAPRLVFRSRVTEIRAIGDPAPYFDAPGCTLSDASRERVAADCPVPSTLLRRELSDAGWTARVNGAPAPVAFAPPLFQSVALPAGRSSVAFSYRPPWMRAAAAGALLALAAMLAEQRRPRRQRRQP